MDFDPNTSNTNQKITFIVGQKTINAKRYVINFYTNEKIEAAKRVVANILDIVSIEETINKPQTTNIKATHKKQNDTIDIYLQAPDVAKACYLLILLGFSLTFISDDNKPLTKKQSDWLIETIRQKIENDQDMLKKQNHTNTKQPEKTQQKNEKNKSLIQMGKQIQSELKILEKKALEAKVASEHLQEKKIKIEKAIQNEAVDLKSTIEETLKEMEKIEMKILEKKEKEEIQTGLKEQKENIGNQAETKKPSQINKKQITVFFRKLIERSILVGLIEIALITYYYMVNDNTIAQNGLTKMIQIGTIGIAYSIRNQLKNKKNSIQLLALIVLIAITYVLLQYI